MLEILDQSTARKTRHQTQKHKQHKQENRQRRARKTETASKAGQVKIPEANRPKCRAPKKEKDRGGVQRGARASNTGQGQMGEMTTKGEPGGQERATTANQNNTKKGVRH